MKNYQIARRDSKNSEETIRGIPMMINLGDLIDGAKTGVQDLCELAGLTVMQLAMDAERERILNKRLGYRHGSQPGYIFFNGKKLVLPHLRSRNLRGEEIPLKSYKSFQSKDEMTAKAVGDLMRGISTREYEDGIVKMLRCYGIKKSSVNRHFIRGTSEKLRELMERRIDKIDPVVIFIDGIGFADNLLVAALGVDKLGVKHTLGLWQGATENSTVCGKLLEDLIARGLAPSRKYLFIIDGGKALKKAIQRAFGEDAQIQRCQEHKKRNVTEHLPKSYQAEIRREMTASYAMTEYDAAKGSLCACVRKLEKINPSAARSLEEGLEETLTLHRLGIPDALRESLRTTNCIESSFSSVENRTARVKRWNGGDQVQRWAATALLMAEKKWRKIKGHFLMPMLLAALGRQ